MKSLNQRRPTPLFQFILLSTVISLSPGSEASAAPAEIHFSDELSFTNNNISGPGSASSSLTEGLNYLNTLGVNAFGKIDDFDYTLNVGGKATDDPMNDVKHLSLTSLSMRATDQVHAVTAGDTFESFSQYSLSSAIKGLSYRFHNATAKSPEFTVVYGMAYPRWDNVWQDADTKSIQRQAGAARIAYNFTPDFDAGFSFLSSTDDERVLNSSLYDNRVYELDAQYRPIPGLTLKGETAFNNTTESTAPGTADLMYHGNALKLEAIGDGGPSRVTLEYERVTPDFITLLGSSTADREKFKANWRYKYDKNIKFKFAFLWYRNNLDGQLSQGTTDHYKPEVGVTIKKLFDRQYATADLGYKIDSRELSTGTDVDHIIDLNYRDRLGIVDTNTNLGYTTYDFPGGATNKQYTYNMSLSSRHTSGQFILKPSVYLGGWTAKDELSDSTDRLYEYSAGLGFDVPEMKITSNIKAGKNKLEKDQSTADDSLRFFANMNVYYRPEFLAQFNQGMLFLRGNLNDFNYTTDTRDFRESSITAGITIQL